MPTKIEWCKESINPVTGCSKCSPGCDNCYAEGTAFRLSRMPKTAAKYAGVVDERGRWTGKISGLDLSVFDRLPQKPCSVFVGSMTDIFHENMIRHVVRVIIAEAFNHPQHTFLFLTKRPDNMREIVTWFISLYRKFPQNIWLGVTVCNQQEVDEKIPILTAIPVESRFFVSLEPLLGPVNLHFGRSDHLPSNEKPFQERHHLIPILYQVCYNTSSKGGGYGTSSIGRGEY